MSVEHGGLLWPLFVAGRSREFERQFVAFGLFRDYRSSDVRLKAPISEHDDPVRKNGFFPAAWQVDALAPTRSP